MALIATAMLAPLFTYRVRDTAQPCEFRLLPPPFLCSLGPRLLLFPRPMSFAAPAHEGTALARRERETALVGSNDLVHHLHEGPTGGVVAIDLLEHITCTRAESHQFKPVAERPCAN